MPTSALIRQVLLNKFTPHQRSPLIRSLACCERSLQYLRARPSLVASSASAGQQVARSRWEEGKAAPTNAASMDSMDESNMACRLVINSHFDSGNIEVVDSSDPSNIQLRIHEDPFCETDGRAHFQWFHYRLTGARDLDLTMNMVNAGKASFAHAWTGYNACASYDRRHWFRVPTSYDESSGALSIQHKPEQDAVYYAYFAPYSYERHQDLIAKSTSSKQVRLEVLGETLDGHDIDLLQIGDAGKGKKRVWIIARQHPGESMAEWFVEGFLDRLLDSHSALARHALQKAVFYVVPNMNPDGSWRGHLRTNAAGANLNREWTKPSLETSPEVYHVRNKMDSVGLDMLLDIHGDEELPYNFINGNEGIPCWGERLAKLQKIFVESFKKASPDFQSQHGYAIDEPNQANLNICGHAIGDRFKTLSLTLEMPFKDTIENPEPVQGWSPGRTKSFGASVLNPIVDVIPSLDG
ncbi:hypothetical protein ABBQ38_011652 [Trebouxia sp. C0009 RCD-2024]